MGQPGRGTGRLHSIGPYTLLDRLGAGGMGVVHRALDRRSGTVVAFKLLHEHIAADPAAIERFRREAHVASLLRSAYAVRLLDFGQEDGRYYLVSEFIEGRSLAEILRKGQPEPLAAIAIVSQAALALDEAESRQVTHRDIKPDNILVTDDGSVKLGDFGIASLPYLSGLTIAGTYVGTVAYSSPEQHRGDADIRSDIYSLGVVLYEMLAGRRPFEATTAPELMRLHAQEPLPLAPLKGVPKELIAVVRQCLEKEPDNRYQHPSELIGALHSVRTAVASAPLDDSWMASAVGAIGATRAMPIAPQPPEPRIAAEATPLAPEIADPGDSGPGGTQRDPVSAPAMPIAVPPIGASPGETRIGQAVASSQGGPPRRMMLIGGGVVAALFIGAVGSVFAFSGGGDDDEQNPGGTGIETRTASPATSATPVDSPTAVGASPSPEPTAAAEEPTPTKGAGGGFATAPAAPTATPRPPTATPAPPTATATSPPAPSFSSPVFAPNLTQSGAPPAGGVPSGGTFGSLCAPKNIYAYVTHNNLPLGTSLTGNWYFNGAFDSSNNTFASSTTDGTTNYQFSNQAGLQAGTYGFVLTSGSATRSQGTVRVEC